MNKSLRRVEISLKWLIGGEKQKMNIQKVIAALVIAIALVGLTGVASAWVAIPYSNNLAQTHIVTWYDDSVTDTYYSGSHYVVYHETYGGTDISSVTDIVVWQKESWFDGYTPPSGSTSKLVCWDY